MDTPEEYQERLSLSYDVATAFVNSEHKFKLANKFITNGGKTHEVS